MQFIIDMNLKLTNVYINQRIIKIRLNNGRENG